MKYKALRSFIRSKDIDKPYDLRNCVVVYDAKSFFNKDTYKNGGCQYIYGAECDRYANYLRMKLNWMTECGITCYVVFNGGMKADLETRKEMHEDLIRNRCQIDPGNVEDNFYDPIFAKNVHLEVLDELGIRYFFSEYDSREAIVSLAKKMRAPVVTNYIEYCFYGVSCIRPDSITFESDTKIAKCRIYLDNVFSTNIGIHICHTPLLLAVLDEDSNYFEYLPAVILGRNQKIVGSIIYWMRRKNRDDAKRSVLSYLRSDSDKNMLLDSYKENENILAARNWDVVRYFQRGEPNSFRNEDDWLVAGISNNKIALPYINLIRMGTLSGCWLIPDVQKDDPLLAAVDIIGFVHCVLKSSRNSIFTFIGRKGNECRIWDIEKSWDSFIKNESIFKRVKTTRNMVSVSPFDISNPFGLFLHESLGGFNYESLMSLRQDSWILIITLVYYIKKRNKDFIKAAYCVLLSYVMLGYVSECVGIIKRSNFTLINNDCRSIGNTNGLLYEDCKSAANSLMDLFYIQDLKGKFNPTILHDFAEFQHCLQHMNFLNKLCGETVKCTVYNKSFNGTFIYNVYFMIKDKENPLEYLKDFLGQLTVTLLFLEILNVFDKCLTSVGFESVMTDLLSSYRIDMSRLNLNSSENTSK